MRGVCGVNTFDEDIHYERKHLLNLQIKQKYELWKEVSHKIVEY